MRFWLTSRFRWPGFTPRERVDAPGFVPATERGRELFKKYGLHAWPGTFGRATLVESLAVLDLLDRCNGWVPGLPLSRPFQLLDIGAKNWRYLPALTAWSQARLAGRPGRLVGLEVDGYQIYRDGTTRRGWGELMSKLCSGSSLLTDYVCADAGAWISSRKNLQADLIFWLFPFVFQETHRSWGLPPKLFNPRALFRSTLARLRTGGILVLANQGEWEWNECRPLLEEITGLRLLGSEIVSGTLHASPHPIALSVWTRVA